MKNIFLKQLMMLSLIFAMVATTYALEVETHKAINTYITQNSLNGFSLGVYLKDQLGFENRIYEKFNSLEVWEWLRDGGEYEDKPPWVIPYLRSVNHFHDPLTEEGFSGYFYGLLLSGDSSVVWAQKPLGTQWPGGHYSWHDARDYFYKALTSSDNSTRNTNFAKTFRGIGQLMHLVHDASVPAHTRNDGHLVGYEKWVDKNINIGTINPVYFDKSILDRPISGLPIANIFDTNQYSGSNPNVTIGNYIGLTEFTNANFFSEHTIFKDFPHPAKENTTANLVEQYAKDGKLDEVWYIQGYTSQRLAAYSYLNKWLLPDKWEYNLDDFVYQDYASQLLPRAVGYSAGLLDYFFRGNIEITLPSSGVYSQTSYAQPFTNIKLLAINTTPNDETMTAGSIELVVKYKVAIYDPFANYPPDYNFQASPEFFYSVAPEFNGVNYIPRDNPVELTFNLSNSPIPLYAIDVYLQVVFKGRLGNEDGAVAVGFKDISEPTPIDFFNDTDKTCLNGNFYTAGSPEAIAEVDTNLNGIADEWDVYAHDMRNIYTRISPIDDPRYASPSSPDNSFVVPSLAAGAGVNGAFILTDYGFNEHHYSTWIGKGGDPWPHSSGTSALWPNTAIKNQTDYVEDPATCAPLSAPCSIWWYPTFLEYMNYYIWGGAGLMYINNAYPAGSECDCYEGILRIRTCPAQRSAAPFKAKALLPEGELIQQDGAIRKQIPIGSEGGIGVMTLP